MECSCEQKQVTWVKLNVTGEKTWQEINLESENKTKQNSKRAVTEFLRKHSNLDDNIEISDSSFV